MPAKTEVIYLLDTDTASNALAERGAAIHRIRSVGYENIWLSSVAVEEMFAGALAEMKRTLEEKGLSKDSIAIERASQYLARLVKGISIFRVWPYDESAHKIMQTYPPAVKRIGTNDCRIAASAMAHNMIVATCNVSDFTKIGVRYKDWSK